MSLGLYVAIGVVLLGLALAYAALRNRGRSHRLDPVADEVVREEYRDGSPVGDPAAR